MAFNTALGMVCVAFIGGVLNLAWAAVPTVLMLVVLVGVAVGASRIVNEIVQWRRRKSVAVAPTMAVSAVAVTGAAVFGAITGEIPSMT